MSLLVSSVSAILLNCLASDNIVHHIFIVMSRSMTCCRTSDHRRQRFSKVFSSPSVRLVRVKDNTFVLINSMAFEGDGCSMCLDAEVRLQQISDSLRCAQVCTAASVGRPCTYTSCCSCHHAALASTFVTNSPTVFLGQML